MSRVQGFGLLFGVLLAGGGQSQDGQQQTARIKVQTTSVVVDVIVTNRKGEPVTNLTASDFKLFEDDAPQKIASFEPPPATRPAPSQGSGSPGGGPASTIVDTRFGTSHFIILVIDVAGLQQGSLQAAIKGGTQYLEKVLSPEDYVAIYWLGNTLHSALPFTRDKAKAVAVLQNLKSTTADGPFGARERIRTQQEIDQLRQQEVQLANQAAQTGDLSARAMADMAQAERMAVQGNLWMQSTFQARAVFQALRAVAQASAVLPGRKNVVLFSEGFVHSPEAQAQAAAVIDAANRADVAIYIVDPMGLTGGRQQSMSDAQNSTAFAAPSGRGASRIPNSATQETADLMRQGPKVTGGYTEFDTVARMGDEVLHDDLSAIAGATGGYLFKNSNDPLHLLNLIDRDLREYYTLVYQPTNQTFDGSMRKIRVDVAGGGYKLRYRKMYFGMPPGEEARMTPAAAQMLAGVANGSLKSTVPSKLNAAVLLSESGDASIPVSVWLPGSDSWVTKSGKDQFNGGATVVIVARDSAGQVAAVQQKFLELNMSKLDYQKVQSDGIFMSASLSVPKLEPYSVQAIFQFSNGAVSINDAKLVVPKQEKTSLTLSSLLVTPRVQAAPDPVDNTNPLNIDAYQLVLPASPQFAKTDKMTVYLVMLNYPHTATGGLQLDMAFAIKSGGKLVRDLAPAELHPFGRLPNAAFLLTQYDMAGLAPGAYTLEAKVHDQAHGTDSVQNATFSVQ